MAGAVWHWYSIGKHKHREVFIPPRAQALPPEVVAAYKKKAEMKIAMGTIGRQSLFITGIAALYFGVELGTGYYRDQYGDWSNTAVAGAVAGCYLGARGGLCQVAHQQSGCSFCRVPKQLSIEH